MPMRGHGNVTGADMVVRWQTGYPFGVNLGRGYPRFNPGEFSTVDLLVRGDADAALILGADPMAQHAAAGHRPPGPHPDDRAGPQGDAHRRGAAVHFTTATYGISAPGTVYRMDEVPLPLRPAFKSPYPTDETVLKADREAHSGVATGKRLEAEQESLEQPSPARRVGLITVAQVILARLR